MSFTSSVIYHSRDSSYFWLASRISWTSCKRVGETLADQLSVTHPSSPGGSTLSSHWQICHRRFQIRPCRHVESNQRPVSCSKPDTPRTEKHFLAACARTSPEITHRGLEAMGISLKRRKIHISNEVQTSIDWRRFGRTSPQTEWLLISCPDLAYRIRRD